MISRYEELVIDERDSLNRFSGFYSIAYKEDFLLRPIVDEYCELLYKLVTSQFPDFTIKEYKNNNVFVTCDVDWPEDPALKSLKLLLKDSAVKIIKQKALLIPLKKILNYLKCSLGLKYYDEYYNNVYKIMDENEKVGNKVAFYFIPFKTSHLDCSTDYNSDKIRKLINDMISRGHEVGVHPGFNTCDNASNYDLSIKKFIGIIQSCDVANNPFGGRQHFLKWESKTTPQILEKNGIVYDSTLSFADISGFRTGTAKTFSMFDLTNRKKLKLKQRPLIAMESTIISPRYEGLGYTEDSFKKFSLLKNRAQKYGGTFTLLWHNSFFYFKKDWEFYKKLIN